MTTSPQTGASIPERAARTPGVPRWLRWSIVALFSWGVWAVMAKLIGDRLSGAHSQALSTLGILPVMVALGLVKHPGAVPGCQGRRGILYAASAGVVACGGNVFYYDLLGRGGKAAMLVPFTALYPLVTVLLALVLLQERLNRVQIAGVLASLAAIYLFNVQQEAGFLSAWLGYALAPILFWGTAGFLQKLSTNHLSGERSTLWFLAAFIPFAAVFLVREALPAHLTATLWLLAAAQGFFLAFGNLAVLVAFASQGKASIIAPLSALYPVVSVPIAIIFLGEKIGPREALGIALALASVAALSWETRPDGPQPRIDADHKTFDPG